MHTHIYLRSHLPQAIFSFWNGPFFVLRLGVLEAGAPVAACPRRWSKARGPRPAAHSAEERKKPVEETAVSPRAGNQALDSARSGTTSAERPRAQHRRGGCVVEAARRRRQHRRGGCVVGQQATRATRPSGHQSQQSHQATRHVGVRLLRRPI